MISIRHSTIAEKSKVYDWLCKSDVTPLMLGEYPLSAIPTFEEFEDDFEDFYFQEDKKEQGSVLIIQKDIQDIGCICYSTSHLKKGAVELDIWLKEKIYLGKGYGPFAINLLVQYLNHSLKITKFIIRPSIHNERAIKAYIKSGFKHMNSIDDELTNFYLDDVSQEIINGDYGRELTSTLVREL